MFARVKFSDLLRPSRTRQVESRVQREQTKRVLALLDKDRASLWPYAICAVGLVVAGWLIFGGM